MSLSRRRFTFTAVAILFVVSLACNKAPKKPLIEVAPGGKRAALVSCNAGKNHQCITCELSEGPLCVMSLEWLKGLESGTSGSQHPPIWVHTTDHLIWIGTTGETNLVIDETKMEARDCDDESKKDPNPPGVPPVTHPDNGNDNTNRILHAQANPNAKNHCFKNLINYSDANGNAQSPIDPHIYVGDN